ncbi:hypothetical protein [Roseicella aerolata]|uniref:Uncharacterized protein n=1 Tax=Roseicella aerolata TaxID=2883479 RepID=A0A9X1IIJ6_9PROT|nr:hypothetical protein [Roseicella aerolata]MCB4824268.1 hypothetical protein [Roseicella aerolata]
MRRDNAWQPPEGVERDFLEALERLKAKRPTNPELARLAKLGRLRITISTVAREAGRSRTLIGHDGCRYPRARAAVVAAMEPVVEPRTTEDALLRLREEVANLQRALKLRDSVNAALVLRMARVEEAAKERVGRAERSAEREDPNVVAGRTLLPRGRVATKRGVARGR